jgi:RimJ/RimL family protein N-acetyltransferase
VIVVGDPVFGSAVADAADFRPYLPAMHPMIGLAAQDGAPIAGVVYTDFTGHSLQMLAARFGTAPITRGFYRAIFDYPFRQLGCRKVFALVNAGNHRALQLDARLGFVVEAVVAGWYRGGTELVILGMTREQCRFVDGSRYR